MFDLLLSYQHLLDVNAVCCEWSLSAAYKFYTALDVGRVPYMISLYGVLFARSRTQARVQFSLTTFPEIPGLVRVDP